MTDAPLTPFEADDALAAEYVLGVQDLAERSAAEARLRRDPIFAALVSEWETRFEGLNHGFDAVPAPTLLPAIEARLFPKTSRPGSAGARFGLLRWLTGAALAASLAIVAVATFVPPQSPLLAVLATPDADLSYEVRQTGDALQITRVAGTAAPTGEVHQLWVIAPGASPVSLGLLAEGPLVVTYPAPPQGWLMAVSVEPAGGSPSGLPTGPVILTAFVASDA